MTRWIAIFLTAMGLVGSGDVYAQEAAPGPGVVQMANQTTTRPLRMAELRFRIYRYLKTIPFPESLRIPHL